MFIIQIIQCVFAGMWAGFQAFLSMLPFYEQLNSLKEQIISAATGIPLWIVSGICLAFGIGSIIKKIYDNLAIF